MPADAAHAEGKFKSREIGHAFWPSLSPWWGELGSRLFTRVFGTSDIT